MPDNILFIPELYRRTYIGRRCSDHSLEFTRIGNPGVCFVVEELEIVGIDSEFNINCKTFHGYIFNYPANIKTLPHTHLTALQINLNICSN